MKVKIEVTVTEAERKKFRAKCKREKITMADALRKVIKAK